MSLLSISFFVLSSSVFAEAFAPDDVREKEIVNMVVQDCGSCHGMTLKGGLGPALTPEAIQGKHDDMLIGTILYGRPGSAMPPWKSFLNENEARWVVEQLKQGNIKR